MIGLLLFAGCSGGGASLDEEKGAVRQCFEDYKQAIAAQDGKTAATLVTGSTLDYYGRMQGLALRGEESEVKGLPFTDKLMVLSLRHRVGMPTLEQMTSESLFVHAVNEGWIDKDSTVANELGEVAVKGESATGVHIFSGEASPYKWTFLEEDGRWRLDINSLLPLVNETMKQLIQQAGSTEEAVLMDALESVSGKEVPAAIWEPLIR